MEVYSDIEKPRGLQSISAFTERYKQIESKPKKQRGLNQITDLRKETATLVNKPLLQIAKLTKNWTTGDLYEVLQASKLGKNPPALWWTIYKQKKHIYGKRKTNKEAIPRVGKERRRQDIQIGQETLF